MVTKWYKILKSLRGSGTSNNTYPANVVKGYSGTEHTTSTAGGISSSNTLTGSVSEMEYLQSGISSPGQIGIFVGSGSTAATDTDYNLETPITTLTRTNQNPGSAAIVEDGYVVGATRSVTYQNNTADPITINEVGVFVRWYWGTSSSNLDTYLIERTVLDTPITLENGESVTITFKMY